MALRILVLSERCPKPDFQSGDRRFAAILELLAQRHRVDFVATGAGIDQSQSDRLDALRQRGVRIPGTGWSGLSRALSSTRYDLVLFEFYPVFRDHAARARERQPDALFVIDSVDVHFAREDAAVAVGLQSAAVAAETREQELRAYRSAGAVIVVTREDQDILRRQGGMPPLFIVPNVLPIRPSASRTRAQDVLFVGGFRHAPNIDAVLWFALEIWPWVRREVPGATFTVVGSHPPPEITALAGTPGIRVLGYVPDTAPFLDDAAVSIAPLRYGAGMKGKVNEAMASGVPVVSTSFGVQGIAVESGMHAEVADDADKLASAVIALLQDPARANAIGLAGQELAKRYSPERVGADLDAMLHQLLPAPRAVVPHLRWLLANARFVTRAAIRAATRQSGKALL